MTAPRRADARRNAAAILEAARAVLTRDPQATVADIAQAAGVGRVTLYGHFPSRAALVDALFVKVNEESDAVLAAVDTRGEPADALARLITETWRIVHESQALLEAAQAELPAERIRQHHDRHFHRLDAVLRRGQRAGVFRRDLSREWLATVYYSTVHAAAGECGAGRLAEDEAAGVIVRTLLAAFTPPGAAVP